MWPLESGIEEVKIVAAKMGSTLSHDLPSKRRSTPPQPRANATISKKANTALSAGGKESSGIMRPLRSDIIVSPQGGRGKYILATDRHPAAGNAGNPIIGTFVLAKRIPHGAEVFKQLALPNSEQSLPFLLSNAVKGSLLENTSMPDNEFVIVVGEYLRDWNP